MLYIKPFTEKTLYKIVNFGGFDGKDELEFFYDDTMFLTGKKGLYCTNKTLYIFSNRFRDEYVLEDLADVEFREIDKKIYKYKIFLKFKDGKEIDFTPKSVPNDEMKLIAYLVNKIKLDKGLKI